MTTAKPDLDAWMTEKEKPDCLVCSAHAKEPAVLDDIRMFSLRFNAKTTKVSCRSFHEEYLVKRSKLATYSRDTLRRHMRKCIDGQEESR